MLVVAIPGIYLEYVFFFKKKFVLLPIAIPMLDAITTPDVRVTKLQPTNKVRYASIVTVWNFPVDCMIKPPPREPVTPPKTLTTNHRLVSVAVFP